MAGLGNTHRVDKRNKGSPGLGVEKTGKTLRGHVDQSSDIRLPDLLVQVIFDMIYRGCEAIGASGRLLHDVLVAG